MTAELNGDSDYLAHYGKLGMRWGHHKAKVAAEKAAIANARSNQAARKNEINDLNVARIHASSVKGKQKIDSLIADKTFELKNNPDAATAARLTTGEKWIKGARVAALIGASLIGLGVAANVIDSELKANAGNGTYTNSGGQTVTMYPGGGYATKIATNGSPEFDRMKGLSK